jgi:hypothetical protein
MGRYKTLIGPRLRARGFAAQQTEAAIGVAVLNWMLVAGRRTPGFCPPPAGHRITARGCGHLALRREVHQRLGDALRSRTDRTEATDVAVAAAALNRMLAFGRPKYVRIA